MSFGFVVNDDFGGRQIDGSFHNVMYAGTVLVDPSMLNDQGTYSLQGLPGSWDDWFVTCHTANHRVSGFRVGFNEEEIRFGVRWGSGTKVVKLDLFNRTLGWSDSSSSGLAVVNAQGSIVFDSRRRYLRIVSIETVAPPPKGGSRLIDYPSTPDATFLMMPFAGSYGTAGVGSFLLASGQQTNSSMRLSWDQVGDSGNIYNWDTLASSYPIIICEPVN